eukprot:2950024-Alexandrium_andersonii.AAC.1
MVGSCDFTTSSQANREIVAIFLPSRPGAQKMAEAFDEIWATAEDYLEAVVAQAADRRASPTPERQRVAELAAFRSSACSPARLSGASVRRARQA